MKQGQFVKSFWRGIPELWPVIVVVALLAFFLFSAFHPAVARIVAFGLSGLMFGFVVLIACHAVQDYLDAISHDREAEEMRMKKLAEDVMES